MCVRKTLASLFSGLVRGFDNFTVIIENEGKQQLVYKHAISTISPAANITIMQPEKREQ